MRLKINEFQETIVPSAVKLFDERQLQYLATKAQPESLALRSVSEHRARGKYRPQNPELPEPSRRELHQAAVPWQARQKYP
jgi:hypothetical protein